MSGKQGSQLIRGVGGGFMQGFKLTLGFAWRNKTRVLGLYNIG